MDQTIPKRHRWTEFGLQLEGLCTHGAVQNGVVHGVTIVTPTGRKGDEVFRGWVVTGGDTLVTHNEAHSRHFYFWSVLFDHLMVFPVVISIDKTTSPRLRPMGPTPPTDQNQLGAAGAELLYE